MSKEEQKYYDLKDILKFINIDYEFDNKKKYPFNMKPDEVEFDWGYITIPRYGIEKIVQNKISDIKGEDPIKEIKMLYNIPFKITRKEKGKNCDGNFGTIIQNISLEFRYDKTYKYGEITKSIEEVCYYILQNAIKTNDFFIITSDNIFNFFSYFIIPNQWGIGSMQVISNPTGWISGRSGMESEEEFQKRLKMDKEDYPEEFEEKDIVKTDTASN